MRRLLAGRVGVAEYTRLLGSLHAIYAALERALDDERVRAVAPMPALKRTDALARDLADFGAGGAGVVPDPLAVDYASHIARLARDDPALVCAHAYVRYLGDLSGGQVLRGIVRRALALPDGRGVSFYALGDKAAVERTKAAIRAALDALPAHRHDDLVAEARGAFARHVALFEALEAA
jgi:heme oxygenase